MLHRVDALGRKGYTEIDELLDDLNLLTIQPIRCRLPQFILFHSLHHHLLFVLLLLLLLLFIIKLAIVIIIAIIIAIIIGITVVVVVVVVHVLVDIWGIRWGQCVDDFRFVRVDFGAIPF